MRGRSGAHRTRSTRPRDHLLRRRSDRGGARPARRRGVRSGPAGGRDQRSHDSDPRHSCSRPRAGACALPGHRRAASGDEGTHPRRHTAAVERAFLGRALRAERARLRGPIVDTQVLGCAWLCIRDGVVRRRIALGELAAELGLPADQPHDGLSDALTTGQVFVALAAHLDATQPETVGTLSGADRRVESLRSFRVGRVSSAGNRASKGAL